MKIVGRYVMKSPEGDLLDAVVCLIDLDQPFNQYVELCLPCSAAFDPDSDNLHFVQLDHEGEAFEVKPIIEYNKLLLTRESWEKFKASVVKALYEKETGLVFAAKQELKWKSLAFSGPFGQDELSFKGNCFIAFDDGHILERGYQGVPNCTMHEMTVRPAYRDLDLRKDAKTGQYVVKDIKDFQMDICRALPFWAKNPAAKRLGQLQMQCFPWGQ